VIVELAGADAGSPVLVIFRSELEALKLAIVAFIRLVKLATFV
jgi:hypothetical protein